MTEHMTADARALAEQAYEHAIRLGYPYLGGKHLLLALATLGQPTLAGTGRLASTAHLAGTGHLAGAGYSAGTARLAGTVLREHGVTPGRVEAEIVRPARWPHPSP